MAPRDCRTNKALTFILQAYADVAGKAAGQSKEAFRAAMARPCSCGGFISLSYVVRLLCSSSGLSA